MIWDSKTKDRENIINVGEQVTHGKIYRYQATEASGDIVYREP